MYLVNKIQFRLSLHFELFDLENMYEFDDVKKGTMKLRRSPPQPILLAGFGPIYAQNCPQ